MTDQDPCRDEQTASPLSVSAPRGSVALASFKQSWQAGTPPDIQDFVRKSGDLADADLAAVVRLDQRLRSRMGRALPTEWYFARFSRLTTSPELAVDVIYNEFLLAEPMGVDVEDWYLRFPEYRRELYDQFELHAAMAEPPDESEGCVVPSAELDGTESTTWTMPHIPGYEVLAEVGRGGMACVYRARDLKLDRIVALKVLRDAGRGESAVRLMVEAQAAARLQHPNILQVFEVREHEGVPYLALEYLDGGTLADYANGRPLTARRAAEIVMVLARAAHHAHRNGIIHRDLKPSNVLIATGEGTGAGAGRHVSSRETAMTQSTYPGAVGSVADAPNEARVLPTFSDALRPIDDESVVDCRACPTLKIADFGLAKMLEVRGHTPRRDETSFGNILGTASYMSPEQARGEVGRISAASDVYSLGAILFELLTGRPPYQAATPIETIRQLTELEVVPPRRLNTQIPADLDTIAIKCLAKNPAERFATAEALADDLQRYLEGRPILSRPIPQWAHAWRWAKRQPVIAGLALAVLISLISGVIGTSLALVEVSRQRTQARIRLTQIEKAHGILTGIFSDLNPQSDEFNNEPLQVVLGRRLEQAARELEQESIGDPLVVARMQLTLGKSFHGLGRFEQAIQLLTRARDSFVDRLGSEHPETLACQNELAESLQAGSKLDQALPIFLKTLRIRKKSLGADHPDTLTSMAALAECYVAAGEFDSAVSMLRDALERRKTSLGAEHPDTIRSMNELAVAYQAAGKLEQALPLFDEALQRSRAALGEEHPNTVANMHNLAMGYLMQGQFDQALPLLEQTLTLNKKLLGTQHPDTLMNMHNLAMGYKDAGKSDRAIPLFERTWKLRAAVLGREHTSTLVTAGALGSMYMFAGKLDRALPLLEETLQLTRTVHGSEHPDTLRCMNNLAYAYQLSGKAELAVPVYEELLAVTKAKLGPEHLQTLVGMNNLASGYSATGRPKLAVPLLEDALRGFQKAFGNEHPNTLKILSNLAVGYGAIGKTDLALSRHEEAARGLETIRFQAQHAEQIVGSTAKAYEKAKQYAPAEAWRRKWVLALKAMQSDGEPTAEYISALRELGRNLVEQRKWADAERALNECVTLGEQIHANDWKSFDARSLLGAALLGQGDFAAAEPHLIAGYEGLARCEGSIPADDKERITEAQRRIEEFHDAR